MATNQGLKYMTIHFTADAIEGFFKSTPRKMSSGTPTR